MNRRASVLAALMTAFVGFGAPAFAQDAEETAETEGEGSEADPGEDESAEEPAAKDTPEAKSKDNPEETSDADTDDADADDAAPDASASAETTNEYVDRRATSGLGFQLELGGLATFRRMALEGDQRTILHRPGIYVGGILRGSQHLLTWGRAKTDLLVEGEGGYGSARNAEVEPALGRQLVTEQTYAWVAAVVEKPLTPSLDLRIGLGGGAFSFTVEPNPDYTGHRYITLVTSFGVTKWLNGPWRVNAGVTFFPGLDTRIDTRLRTEESASEYGAARSFGARAELEAVWRFFQPEENDLFGTAELSARYSYTRFRTTLPETFIVGDLAGTDDNQQQLVVMLGYYL